MSGGESRSSVHHGCGRSRSSGDLSDLDGLNGLNLDNVNVSRVIGVSLAETEGVEEGGEKASELTLLLVVVAVVVGVVVAAETEDVRGSVGNGGDEVTNELTLGNDNWGGSRSDNDNVDIGIVLAVAVVTESEDVSGDSKKVTEDRCGTGDNVTSNGCGALDGISDHLTLGVLYEEVSKE